MNLLRTATTIVSASIMVISLLTACGKTSSEKSKIGSITLYGNSITKHDPAPSIGWDGDWGMAASCRDSDYVHRIQSEIAILGQNTEVTWQNLAAFERDWETYDLSQFDSQPKSDLIVIKISENIKYTEGMESAFESRFHQLVKKLSGPETVVVVAGGFWPSPVNDMLKHYAESHDLQYVPLADLFENDKKNAAIGLFENEGVANHPSDQGMRHIAERIMQVLRQYEYK